MLVSCKKLIIRILAIIVTVSLGSGAFSPIHAHADAALNPNGFTVLVKYLDEAGTEIAPSETLTDYYYVSVEKNIPGYKLKETPSNATGRITDSGIEVHYIYERAIKVSYVDETGKDLLPTVEVADSDAAVLETIPDYTFVRKDVSADSSQIIFRYKKNVSTIPDFGKPNQVTVNYVDENNTQIAPSLYLSGLFDEAYKVPMKKIKGYTLLKYDPEILGVFTESAQTINIIYQKDAPEQTPSLENPPEPIIPAEPQLETPKVEITEKPNSPKEQTTPTTAKTTKVEAEKQSAKAILPKTGDSSIDLLITCLGIIIISCGIYLLVQQTQKRRRKE
ncbi:MucBP domain-containing protein [Listeria cossartiae subsp. cayugensis]|uniref:MucBP domain-containing protein n=1 Tax=Listeria cossartiae TaxID=2838249 RepID=UPI0028806E42|nr:MucBP domain-containing protein [Listeria cossartiae]MDS9999272.1 MucBP domain-containing protein [Listeria cossartiae subsp. cayugensis]MDT0008281.1 MucBP domain-containing protein [Listeria cossartiae subsp. cayugensis]MDT0029304.1 MucBP domain-containing protein [Listeria cossartiae subsp. cayugensis]MDT0037419.1 MucBP domain-containing protein [Listeria cossartiae subsp. cayugensis]MDT0042769.1 MucBP domain-containing protein [Listeria cossartiae subsp. cayugensis]